MRAAEIESNGLIAENVLPAEKCSEENANLKYYKTLTARVWKSFEEYITYGYNIFWLVNCCSLCLISAMIETKIGKKKFNEKNYMIFLLALLQIYSFDLILYKCVCESVSVKILIERCKMRVKKLYIKSWIDMVNGIFKLSFNLPVKKRTGFKDVNF